MLAYITFFHGIVHNIVLTTEDVSAYKDKNSTFEEIVNPYLMEIQNLRLDWLHVKTLQKTKWLAEDRLVFFLKSPVSCTDSSI